MRATQIMAPGKFQIVDIPKPTIGPNEALVRTTQVSLCGSDYHTIYCSSPSSYPLPPGMSGHEVVGVVEEMNGAMNGLKVGDPVLALVRGNRGMADYSAVPLDDLLPLSNHLPTDQLLQAQQLGTVLYASKHLPANVVAQRVVVIGQGSAGLWWNYVMRRYGARQVIAVDLQAHRLAVSKAYGATHTVHNLDVDALTAVQELTNGEMADIVVEAAGEAETIRMAVSLVRKNGAILYFGVPRIDTMEYPIFELFRKTAIVRTIVGALSDPNHECTRMALDLIERGDAQVGPMITHHFPFDEVADAFELQTTRDEGAIKIVVDF
ncbi:MAG: zinc-binding dehydrogenase [Candidatus Competibacteraceae bacterium]|nr:zinc-binding dehydrogenase [Candidatus Competibacteraceae bacterium]